MTHKNCPSVYPFDSDEQFDAVLPLKIKKLSSTHWTPVEVAKRAAEFLVQHDNSKILDIGSGVGKFCLTAAAVSPGHFTGVEQREFLVHLSKKLAQKLRIKRAEFIHANILSIDFQAYDGFYFFNSFEENLNLMDKIDDDAEYNPARYKAYSQFLLDQFEMMPLGTRIATYCSPSSIVPLQYVMLNSDPKDKLKLWEKRY